MKLDDYSKFTGNVMFYMSAPHRSTDYIKTSDDFTDVDSLIKYTSDTIGPSLRKSDISKIIISVKIHTAKYSVEYIPELYMTGWEKTHYSMCLPGQLYNSIRGFFDFWLDPAYSMKRVGLREIEKLGVMYET